jgi:HPt (histidine-containing phosphotransfer) domain-containing protein
MDCQMPELDGLEAARAVRAAEAGGRRTAIVAVTASATSDEVAAALSAGMDACLTKPFSTAQLSETLARVLAPASALEQLRADVGDDDAVDRIAGIYLHGLPGVRSELVAALDRGDAGALRAAAHRLRSSSATFGAHRLAELCAELEHGAADGAASRLVAAIERECRRVEESLAAELRRRSS